MNGYIYRRHDRFRQSRKSGTSLDSSLLFRTNGVRQGAGDPHDYRRSRRTPPRVIGVLNFGVIWLTEMRGAECAREFRGSGCIRDLERVCSARAHEGHQYLAPCHSERKRSRGGLRTAPARAGLKRCGGAGTPPYPCHSERSEESKRAPGPKRCGGAEGGVWWLCGGRSTATPLRYGRAGFQMLRSA